MNEIDLLKELIKKSTDEKEIENYNEKLLDAIKKQASEEAEKKLKAEAEEKARQEALEKAAKPDVKIEVPANDEVCGFKLRRAVNGLKANPKLASVSKNYDDSELEKLAAHLARVAYNGGITPNGALTKAMNEGTASAGGYITPTEERFMILSYIRAASVAMNEATHIPMTSDVMTIPTEATGVSVGITSEGTEATETTPSLGLVTLTAKKIDGRTQITHELLNDNAVPGGILSWLLEMFVEAVGQKIDSIVFLDPGSGSGASGIFKSYGYSTILASATFASLAWADVPKAVSKIPAQYINDNYKWYMSHSVLWTYFYTLKDGNERPIFVQDYSQGASYRIAGFPVVTPSQAITTSAASTAMAVLTDLKRQYIIGDRLTDMTFFINPYKVGPHITEVTMLTRFAFANALKNYAVAIVTAA